MCLAGSLINTQGQMHSLSIMSVPSSSNLSTDSSPDDGQHTTPKNHIDIGGLVDTGIAAVTTIAEIAVQVAGIFQDVPYVGGIVGVVLHHKYVSWLSHLISY